VKTQTKSSAAEIPNGSGAAAILAAGVGAFVLAVFDMAAEKVASIKHLMNFYNPTGPLSGVTTLAIVLWLACWLILDWRWRKKNVAIQRISTTALLLLVLSLLLTFPVLADVF